MDSNTAKASLGASRTFFAEMSDNKQQASSFGKTDLENPIVVIYRIANGGALSELLAIASARCRFISPGTPAMAAVWILLAAKAGDSVELI